MQTRLSLQLGSQLRKFLWESARYRGLGWDTVLPCDRNHSSRKSKPILCVLSIWCGFWMIQFDLFAIFTFSLRSPAEANTFLFFFIALTFLCNLSIYLHIYLSIVVRDLIYSCATNCISIGCVGRQNQNESWQLCLKIRKSQKELKVERKKQVKLKEKKKTKKKR